MKVEKSSFGYTLNKHSTDEKSSDNVVQTLSSEHIQFLSGLLKRLRNLFLSVVPTNYCCIKLLGVEDDQGAEKIPFDQSELRSVKLEYLGHEIALMSFQRTDKFTIEDEDKVVMLTDLFGYLVYYHLLMYEYLVND